ncbi:MAG: DUF72 domain-containing protein [Gaiellaceae bacterium]
MATAIRIGTCSWADEALSKYWYPKGTPAAERLPYYAEHFDTVEVDSTYYRLPAQEMVSRWAERTPEGFVMHVKAFGVMTRHAVKIEQLPPDLRDEAPVDARGRLERPSREFRGEIFRRFREALEPLRETGKLGGILFQFAPYVVPKEASLDYLEWARGQMEGDEMLVEFRHRAWYEDGQREETLAFLEQHGMTHVVVDAPKVEAKNVPLTVVALTSRMAYVRFHGRNADTWNVRGRSAAERFDYLYSEEELEEWVDPLREVAGQAEHAYVLFNNNNRSRVGGREMAQAPTNAEMLREVLERSGVAVSAPPAGARSGSR